MSILRLQTLKPRTTDLSYFGNSCTSSRDNCCVGSAEA
ncbi:class III lanthipeptide [Rhizocola hellebori]|nr:class III lanthipeptide [Rhizocola hellebori]